MRQGRLWEERPFGEPASEKMTWRGGVMQVQNTGSTFFFVLPLRQPKKDNAGGAAGGSKAEPGGSGEQELVKEYRCVRHMLRSRLLCSGLIDASVI